MEAPAQITATKPGDYLEVMTKAVFESGMSWRVVENKWASMTEAVGGWDPERIANFGPEDIDRLTSDTRMIRNRKKIESTVHNAETVLALEREFGSFAKYLKSQGEFEPLVKDMKSRFKHLGNFGCYYFLWVVKEPVPDHHEFREKLKTIGR
ncbi:MAG: DNA-3-methyladenine glycosylase I [Dehalococcoidia bacterium]